MDLKALNQSVLALIENSTNIITFLRDFILGDSKDVSIVLLDARGNESIKTFPNLAKIISNMSMTNVDGVIYDADGKVLVHGGDTGWMDLKPYLSSGWVEYSKTRSVQYRIIGRTVYFRGLISGGSSSLVMELPSFLIPSQNVYLPNSAYTKSDVVSGSFGFTVYNNGSAKIYTYSTTWTSISCSYLLD